MKKINIFLILSLFFIAGCDNNHDKNKQEAYLMGHNPKKQVPKTTNDKTISKAKEKITLASMEASHQEKLASIKSQKEQELKKLELEKSKQEDQTKLSISKIQSQSNVEIEKSKQKTEIVLQKTNKDLSQQYAIAVVILILALLALIYVLKSRSKKIEQKMHEDELRHKEYMMQTQQYHERINKTLNLIANKNTDKSLKKELIELLKDQKSEQPKMIEN